MDMDQLMNCMRCGFCLPSCPTYIETGRQESQSPRGRIALMKAVVDGAVEPDEQVEHALNMCLGCRACEPVCPSGVHYGYLLEEARDVIWQNKKASWPVRLLRHLVFDQLFPHKSRLQLLVGAVGLYQRSGLQWLARKTKLLNVLPANLRQMEKVLPALPRLREMRRRPQRFVPAQLPKRRVAFFAGCLMDTMFKSTNDATIELLQMAGCEVFIPSAQTCCGALHGHGGEKEKAKMLAKRNIEAFEAVEADVIVTNAGGCGAYLFEYDHLLQDDAEWAERARQFASKVKDVSDVLVEMKFHEQSLKARPEIVTYQDSCHLRNVMKVSRSPRLLLNSVEGVQFREMNDADRCCGSAGIYNLVQPDMAIRILDHKMDYAKQTDATTIVTSNPGCLLQMKLGIERAGLSKRVRAVHLVDFLLEAVKYQEGGEFEDEDGTN